MARTTRTYISPEPPPAPVKADASGESCATCRGSRAVGGILQCHGQPPMSRYTNTVMGVGPVADPLWPTVQPTDWCMKFERKP